jgi:hypothetical protein
MFYTRRLPKSDFIKQLIRGSAYIADGFWLSERTLVFGNGELRK